MGGRDQTVLMARYGDWMGEPMAHMGTETPDAGVSSGLVLQALRDGAPACVDVVGPGGQVYGVLVGNNVNAVACDGGKPSKQRDKTGRLGFADKRAEWYWRMREALDPAGDFPLSLPPNATLRSDLCAPRYSVERGRIRVERKPDIIKRIGRSPDFADAAVYALIDKGERPGMVARGSVVVETVSGNYDAQDY